MAKHKDDVQHTDHVRTIRHPDGNQGFNTMNVGSMGGDTVPGSGKGAPLSSKVQKQVSKKTVHADGMNPFNKFEGDASGVLGANVVHQDAPGHDSPVPGHAQKPNLSIRTKAEEAGSHEGETTFPSEGVMHR